MSSEATEAKPKKVPAEAAQLLADEFKAINWRQRCEEWHRGWAAMDECQRLVKLILKRPLDTRAKGWKKLANARYNAANFYLFYVKQRLASENPELPLSERLRNAANAERLADHVTFSPTNGRIRWKGEPVSANPMLLIGWHQGEYQWRTPQGAFSDTYQQRHEAIRAGLLHLADIHEKREVPENA